MKYKVMIVDDHPIFRNGFKMVINGLSNASLVAEASNGKEFLDIISENRPDLVFMDIEMAVMDGIAASKAALAKFPDLKIVAFTTHESSDYATELLKIGVEGYLLKDADYEEVEQAIEQVMNGRKFFSDRIMTNLTINLSHNINAVKALEVISNREFEVLRHICRGSTIACIAENLNVTPRTIEKHKESLMRKTNSRNTVNLVIYAFLNNLVSKDDLRTDD